MAKKKSQAQLDAEEALRLIEKEAELRARMNSSYDEYIKAVKEAHLIQKTLTKNTQLQADVQAKVNDLKAKLVGLTGAAYDKAKEELDIEEEKLKILDKQNEKLKKQVSLYKSAAKEANVLSMAAGKAGANLVKGFANLPNVIKGAWGKIEGLGLFEFDKAVKQSALSMGVLSKEGVGFRNNLKNAAKETSMMGVNLKGLAELQSSFSENLGRSVVLSQKGLEGMAAMSKMTGLGAEGTAQMAADMDLQGVSAERTADFVDETLKASSKMGVNATKVMKNLAGNLKLMNKYHFKEGSKGLAKMAQLVTKLGIDMSDVSGMADKLWNIEGAVEMSAQLNVMGGAWAQMADPFHLMYMARNDMNGLTEEIARASQESISFNKATGEFDMTAEGMHRLKIIAEQTGIEYEKLVTMGKNMAKFDKVKSQIGFSIGGSDEDKEMLDYISNKSQIGKDGKAEIFIGGSTKLVSQLTNSDKKLIQAQILQQEDMRKRAEEARSFDEQLTYFMDNMKVTLLPLIESFNKEGGLADKLDLFVKDFNKPGGMGETVSKFAGIIGDFVSSIGAWMLEHPTLTAALWAVAKGIPLMVGAFKILGGLWDIGKWFVNGVSLGKGFMSVAGGMGGPGGGSGSGPSGGGAGGYGKNFRNNYKGLRAMGDTRLGAAKSAFKWGGGTKGLLKGIGGRALGVAGLGLDAISSYQANKEAGMSTGENVGKTATSTATKGVGAWAGGLAGAKLGATIGAFGGPIGLAIGGLLGGAIGGLGGYFLGGKAGEGINSLWGKGDSADDAYFNAPVKDGLFSGGFKKSLMKGLATSMIPAIGPMLAMKDMLSTRGVIQGGKITPIDTRDDVLALKKGGAIDKYAKPGSGNVNGTVRHTFETLNINGKIIIEGPGGQVINKNVLENESFRRQIAAVVQQEVKKRVGMGKMQG